MLTWLVASGRAPSVGSTESKAREKSHVLAVLVPVLCAGGRVSAKRWGCGQPGRASRVAAWWQFAKSCFLLLLCSVLGCEMEGREGEPRIKRKKTSVPGERS